MCWKVILNLEGPGATNRKSLPFYHAKLLNSWVQTSENIDYNAERTVRNLHKTWGLILRHCGIGKQADASRAASFESNCSRWLRLNPRWGAPLRKPQMREEPEGVPLSLLHVGPA